MTECLESVLAAEEATAKMLRIEAGRIGERLQHLSALRQRLTREECEELQRLRASLAEAQRKLAETVATIEAWTSYGNEGGSHPVQDL